MPNDSKLSFSASPLTKHHCAILITLHLLHNTHTLYKREFHRFKYLTMATGRTWAQVSRKKAPPALPTECAVNLEQYAAPLRLPPSSSRHSAFIPLPFDFENNWMLDTLSSLPASTVAVVPRQA